MSAYICMKPKYSCHKCNHYRYDEDYGNYVCYAEKDNDNDVNHNIKVIIEANNYQINKKKGI